jgi:hypothetical protein
MIVRAGEGSPPETAFDYIVHGLRVGFEEVSVVQEKTADAYIPSIESIREPYDRLPESRRYNALERFKSMTATVLGSKSYEPDLSAAEALRSAIGVYDPEVHVDPRRIASEGRASIDPSVTDLNSPQSDPVSEPGTNPEPVRREPDARPSSWSAAAHDSVPMAQRETETVKPLPDGTALFPVTGSVEPGDLLALDPDAPGRLRRADVISDPAVVGIAVGEFVEKEGEPCVPVAGSGFALVNADATYGAIQAGDLLTSSPTPGHAIATLAPAPGTVIGKALEPLVEGTGAIRVLVTPR